MAPPRAASWWRFPANWDCQSDLWERASRSTTSFRSKRKLTRIPYSTEIMNAHDIRFMQHALALARKGIGLASPNPMVGCVIVREGEIVVEGFHQYEWSDHAEIVAPQWACERPRSATPRLTSEPCNPSAHT